ncbi:MAG: response regulator [Deltaproteobacteria bacterium]|nr:response regulator [Deltaproteobacteria bacterium]
MIYLKSTNREAQHDPLAQAPEIRLDDPFSALPHRESFVLPQRENLLQKINAAQLTLGQQGEYSEVPDVPLHVYETLRGKRVLMVDDTAVLLAIYSRFLVSASDGHSDFVLHLKHMQKSDLMDAIIAKRPDVILLDYELEAGLKGPDLVAPLREQLPNCLLIGFSSVPSCNQFFIEAGADGAVLKRVNQIPQTLERIAEVVKSRG